MGASDELNELVITTIDLLIYRYFVRINLVITNGFLPLLALFLSNYKY